MKTPRDRKESGPDATPREREWKDPLEEWIEEDSSRDRGPAHDTRPPLSLDDLAAHVDTALRDVPPPRSSRSTADLRALDSFMPESPEDGPAGDTESDPGGPTGLASLPEETDETDASPARRWPIALGALLAFGAGMALVIVVVQQRAPLSDTPSSRVALNAPAAPPSTSTPGSPAAAPPSGAPANPAVSPAPPAPESPASSGAARAPETAPVTPPAAPAPPISATPGKSSPVPSGPATPPATAASVRKPGPTAVSPSRPSGEGSAVRSRDTADATTAARTEPGDPAARGRAAAPVPPEPAPREATPREAPPTTPAPEPVVPAPLPEPARLTPATPTPTPAIGRADPEAAARASIGTVLDSYREALNRLDAASAASVWRGADTPGLARAFASLSSQDVRFDKCDIALNSGSATATCRGAVNYVPRVGSRSERMRPLTWTIRLVEANDRWLIDSVTTR